MKTANAPKKSSRTTGEPPPLPDPPPPKPPPPPPPNPPPPPPPPNPDEPPPAWAMASSGSTNAAKAKRSGMEAERSIDALQLHLARYAGHRAAADPDLAVGILRDV